MWRSLVLLIQLSESMLKLAATGELLAHTAVLDQNGPLGWFMLRMIVEF
jgi:hypothetical protein